MVVKKITLLACLAMVTVSLGCSAKGDAGVNKSLTAQAKQPNVKVQSAKQSKLAPCPNRPNCVSSMESNNKDSYIKPLDLAVGMALAKRALKKQLLAMPRSTLVAETDNSFHVTVKSKLFGFVDDINVIFTPTTIHIRSASRTGYSDLGVNRERVELIRRAMQQMGVVR